jgi:hypothetical protein
LSGAAMVGLSSMGMARTPRVLGAHSARLAT